MTDTAALGQQLLDLQAELENSCAQLFEKDQELERLRSVADEACAEAAEAMQTASMQSSQASCLQQELEVVSKEAARVHLLQKQLETQDI